MTFAIDKIPSLVDGRPYHEYVLEFESDGVPEAIGEEGESEKQMPPPPRSSRPVRDYDKTRPFRKVVL